MPDCEAFQQVLATLARPFSRNADTLLDLRQWVGDERRVGSYVKAYFDLLQSSSVGGEAARGLVAMRQWLEANLEIVVLEGTTKERLESWPLRLEGESSLEGFCRKAMDQLREDRCHTAPRLQMEFRFRHLLAAA